MSPLASPCLLDSRLSAPNSMTAGVSPPITLAGPKGRGRTAWRLVDLTLASVLAAIFALTVATGAAPNGLFAHDTFFFLENGYRTLAGQVPHRDFPTAWGPVTYLTEALGLRLSNLRPDGIAYANAVFGLGVAIWCYSITRSRMNAVLAWIAAVYTMLLATAPYALGYPAIIYTHAMTYNRHGYALLGIVVLESCLDRAPTRVHRFDWGAHSTGAAFAVLGFLKVSYALAAVPFVLLSFAFKADRIRRFAGLAAGFAVVSLLFLSYLQFNIGAMFADLWMAASQRSGSVGANSMSAGIGRAYQIFPFLFLAAAAIELTGFGVRKWLAAVRPVVLAVLTMAIGAFLMSTNNQPGAPVLNLFVGLVFFDALLKRLPNAPGWRLEMPRWLTVFILFPLVLSLLVPEFIGLIGGAIQKARTQPTASNTLNSPVARGLLILPSPEDTETSGPTYVRAVNEGLELLEKHTRPDEGVFALDPFNPFNYLLGRKPPTGGLTTAAFSISTHPSPDRLFGNSKVIMVRKYTNPKDDFGVKAVRKLYETFLRQSFTQVTESRFWIVYRRNTTG